MEISQSRVWVSPSQLSQQLICPQPEVNLLTRAQHVNLESINVAQVVDSTT